MDGKICLVFFHFLHLILCYIFHGLKSWNSVLFSATSYVHKNLYQYWNSSLFLEQKSRLSHTQLGP
jgi:hypothetical protein